MTEPEEKKALEVEFITEEDLRAIKDAKASLAYARVLTDKSIAERQIAELRLSNIHLRAFVKYGLAPSDSIDVDGRITRSAPPQQNQIDVEKDKSTTGEENEQP